MGLVYRVRGGKPVTGEIRCHGAKNLATKTIVASMLTSKLVKLYNVPRIGDVQITIDLIKQAGCDAQWVDDNTLLIDPANVHNGNITEPDSGANRIPILLMGPLLHRLGKVKVPVLGGDKIGTRKVDFHVKAMEAFGANVTVADDSYYAELPAGKRLQGIEIELPYPSVGATETCLFLAVLAEGVSVIKNIAIEPEIMEIITMLRSMGALIFESGNRELRIEGVDKLHQTQLHLIGDRIEAVSWASLAIATNGRIKVKGVGPSQLGNFLSHYEKLGGRYELLGDKEIEFYRGAGELRPLKVETDVFPGFATDWQQPFAVALTLASGMSVIHETVYENRLGFLEALRQFGATTQTTVECLGSQKCRYRNRNHKHSALIFGPAELRSNNLTVQVPDIRAGLAYLIAAAAAEGVTTLTDIDHIERGYGNLKERMQGLNIDLERLEENAVTPSSKKVAG
jgi:UDP-N-acetylglucosamine 1-carboxyvinyltransferase